VSAGRHLVWFVVVALAARESLAQPAADPARTVESDANYQIETLEELLNAAVTTASRSAEKLEDAPGSLTVITRQQIAQMNAQTLRDVLNVLVPGMDVVPTYFRYGDRVNEGIYSRGLLSDFAQQVLILWNSHSKFNETTWGSPFPAIEFTLENVERIEVSRSPLPLYGGGAFTVINIITKEQHLKYDAQFQGNVGLSARAGSQARPQSRKFSSVGGYDVGGWHLGGSVQYYDDRGQPHDRAAGRGEYPLAPDTLRDGTKGAANITFSVKSPGEKLVLQSWYKYANRDAFLSAQLPSASQDQYFYRGTEWLTHLVYNPTPALRLVAGAQTSSWFNFYEIFPPADMPDAPATPAGGGERNYDLFVEATHTLKFEAAGSHSLLSGVKLEREGQYQGAVYTWDARTGAFSENRSPEAIFAPNVSRTVPSLFLEDSWKPADRLSVLAGFRLDHYRGFGDKKETLLSPRLALRLNPTKGLVVKALYAAAGRPPAIYERAGKNALPLQGREDIRSERVDTFELSALYRTERFRVQLTPFLGLFSNKIEYLPETLPDGTPVQVASNNGRTQSAGVDAEAWFYLDQNNYFFANGTWLRSRDQESAHQTHFLPSTYLNAGLNLHRGGWNLNLAGYFRSNRPLPGGPVELGGLPVNRQNVHAALRTNGTLSYYFRRTLKAYLLVENLTDAETNIPLSVDGLFVPMRGRTFLLGLVFGLTAVD
jgi:outer membrane receptor for ferrienterochelin and colicins